MRRLRDFVGMHRSRAVLVLLATLAIAAPTTRATMRGPTPTTCQRLKAHNRDQSPNHKLVLVRRGSDEVGNIAACLLPRGRVRRLASWDDDLDRDRYSIGATSGLYVLIAHDYGDQYRGVSSSLTRFDARSGRGVRLASYGCQEDYGQTSCPDGTSYGKFVLAASGAGALELTDLLSGLTTLQSFDSAGALARLDDGPVDALSLSGGEIVWTRAGVEHRAPLPGQPR